MGMEHPWTVGAAEEDAHRVARRGKRNRAGM